MIKSYNIGEKNPNYKHGLCCQSNHCIDCGKELSDYRVKRCPSHAAIHRIKTFGNSFLGKHHTEKSKQKIREKALGRIGFWKDKNLSQQTCIKISKNHRDCKGENNPMFGVHRFGKKAPNWQDGRTALMVLIRNCQEMDKWRSKVFNYDNYTCQLCHDKDYHQIEGHHKIPINVILDLYNIKNLKDALKCELLWDYRWGITLCDKCHKELGITNTTKK